MENQKDLLIKDMGANRSEVIKNFKVLLEQLNKQTKKTFTGMNEIPEKEINSSMESC